MNVKLGIYMLLGALTSVAFYMMFYNAPREELPLYCYRITENGKHTIYEKFEVESFARQEGWNRFIPAGTIEYSGLDVFEFWFDGSRVTLKCANEEDCKNSNAEIAENVLLPLPAEDYQTQCVAIYRDGKRTEELCQKVVKLFAGMDTIDYCAEVF